MAMQRPYTIPGMMGTGFPSRAGGQLPPSRFPQPIQTGGTLPPNRVGPPVGTGGSLPPGLGGQLPPGLGGPIPGRPAVDPAQPVVDPKPMPGAPPLRMGAPGSLGSPVQGMPSKPAMPTPPGMMHAARGLATNGMPTAAANPTGRPAALKPPRLG